MIGAKQQKQKTGGNTAIVFVGNLRFQTSEQELMDFFKQNKLDPVRARLLYDNEGNSKGIAFVELSSETEAQDAIKKLNNETFGGRKITVTLKN